MSADPLSPTSKEPTGGLTDFALWMTVGAAGVALMFVVAEQLPQRFKVPVFFMIGLETAAAWGLGRWGAARLIRPTTWFALAVWVLLAGNFVLMSVKIHHDGVKIMRAQKQWQETPGDPISENLKQFLMREPEGETDEDRMRRLEILGDVERGEAMRKQRLEYLTFYGYLSNRIPKEWGKWQYPWPAVFWVVEILVGSTWGSWLALWALRAGLSPCAKKMTPTIAGSPHHTEDKS